MKRNDDINITTKLAATHNTIFNESNTNILTVARFSPQAQKSNQ